MLAWPGLIFALIGFGIIGSADTMAQLRTRSVIGGLFGIPALVLGIYGVKKAKVLHRGRVISVIMIVIGCLLAIQVFRPALDAARERTMRQIVTELVGKTVPSFSLRGLDGRVVTDADLQGSIYVLAFELGPDSLLSLGTAYKRHKGNGLRVFAVYTEDYAEPAAGFVRSNSLGIPVMDTNDAVVRAFHVHFGKPEVVFVGQDGTVVSALFGSAVDSGLDSAMAVIAPAR